MNFEGMDAAAIRLVIREAQERLERMEAVEAARLAVVEAVQAYADAAGVTVDEAWKTLAPSDDTTEPPDLDGISEYVKPTGAHDAYAKGDLVTFQGQVYRARMDAVTWSPIAYPQAWEKVV